MFRVYEIGSRRQAPQAQEQVGAAEALGSQWEVSKLFCSLGPLIYPARSDLAYTLFAYFRWHLGGRQRGPV